MADRPHGKRYEVRINKPESDFRYEIVLVHEHGDEIYIDATFTMLGARRAIRKHRKRVNQYGDQVGSVVYWERF